MLIDGTSRASSRSKPGLTLMGFETLGELDLDVRMVSYAYEGNE
jgi:hypothetical protein